MSVKLPVWAKILFEEKRYSVLYGGRGSGKSFAIAIYLLIRGVQKRSRVLCAREFQNSISESVHKLFQGIIEENESLRNFYSITRDTITGLNGTQFIFKGVRHNVQSIKSMAGITDLWLEEAQTVSQESWDIFVPTIREDGSRIYVTFNPDKEDDPTYKKFIKNRMDEDQINLLKINWNMNPYFPEVLRKERDYMYRTDPDLAMHVWEGECRTHSDAQIFKNKWEYKYFDIEDHWDGPYFGADWGFSVDPTTLVKIYLDMQNRNIMIRSEAYAIGCELDDLPELFDKVQGSRERLIRADNARPETISYISRKRFMIEAAEKWPGSVEDGIEWLKSFNKIIIHTDCPHMKDEAKNYSYKVDRLTGDITTDIVDAHNHLWDATRYALQPLIRSGHLGLLDVL